MSEAKALQLKTEGNRCFQQGDYVGAEGFYSKAYAFPFPSPFFFLHISVWTIFASSHDF